MFLHTLHRIVARWGGPAARMCAPTLAAVAAALPPEGEQFAPWGGPAARMCAPTLAAAAAALPPEGEQFAPWGGPAALILAALMLAVPLFLVPSAGSAADDSPLVAAASDLQFALNEIAAAFEHETGKTVRIVYGSSGNFRRQIAEGGPFEVFLSADQAYVMALAGEGYTVDEGVQYAVGRLALVVPEGSALKLDPTLRDLGAAVADGRVRKFAIANPEHAPYGRAAREALSAAGVWESVRGYLVFGENIAQAAQFATSGSAQGGIVALSLALAPGALGAARYVAIPEKMHKPLVQRMVLTKRAGGTAREFYRYLQQPAARAVFRRYGFAVSAAGPPQGANSAPSGGSAAATAASVGAHIAGE